MCRIGGRGVPTTNPALSDNQSVLEPAQTRNITLAVTGASGSIYAAELLRALAADSRVTKINFVASDNSLRVFA